MLRKSIMILLSTTVASPVLAASTNTIAQDASVSALRSAGRKVEFIRYKDLDHQIDDSNARADMLNRIGIALKAAIGR